MGSEKKRKIERQTLTKKQREFCEEYVRTGNATRSYMVAYEKTEDEYDMCSVEGSKMLRKQEIREYISELAKVKNVLVEEEWLCDRLIEIINNPATKEQDRLKAIDMLLKTTGSYTQKIDANVTGTQTIVVTIDDEEEDDDIESD
mgnify:CR=1 FL=1